MLELGEILYRCISISLKLVSKSCSFGVAFEADCPICQRMSENEKIKFLLRHRPKVWSSVHLDRQDAQASSSGSLKQMVDFLCFVLLCDLSNLPIQTFPLTHRNVTFIVFLFVFSFHINVVAFLFFQQQHFTEARGGLRQRIGGLLAPRAAHREVLGSGHRGVLQVLAFFYRFVFFWFLKEKGNGKELKDVWIDWDWN